MSGQLLLLEVPKDSPSHAERLQAFCEREKIFTYDCDIDPEDDPWIAMILPGNPRGISVPYEEFFATKHKSDPMDFFFGYCRLLDESGRCAFGKTQREAVDQLCANVGIPFFP